MTDLLIDGNSLFARCWFAVKEDPDEALRACVTSTLRLLDQGREGCIRVPIHRTMFGWDGKAKTDKNRAPKPKAYIDTRYRFQEILLSLFNTVHGFHADYEADDIVATAAYASRSDRVFIVSGDKDLMQLQGGNVFYYDLNEKVITPARKICAKFSIKKPCQIPLALAIIGDTSDGISGIPRWGPKKSAKLFEAVTEDMDFGQALQALQLQIPQGPLMDAFMDSLDKTLLHTDVPDTAEPSPLRFYLEPKVLDELDGVSMAYDRVASQYEDRAAINDDMLKDSRSGSRRPRLDQSSE